jgi:hypothetical protein
MTLTRRPSPFSELVTLRPAMDRLFDDTVFRPYTAYNGHGDLAVSDAPATPATKA